jgi:hypothetical protein
MDGSLTHDPPHNFEAEQAVIGTMLTSEIARNQLVNLVLPEHCADPFHGKLIHGIRTLMNQGRAVNPITLSDLLGGDEALEAVGGMSYFAGLARVSVDAETAGQYAQIVVGHFRRRKLVDTARAVLDDDGRTSINGVDPLETIERAMSELKGGALANARGVAASPYKWIDPKTIEPRQWLFGRHLIRKFLSVTVSAAGIGKSSLEIMEAVSMAVGRDLLTGQAIEPRTVWYVNLEDPLEELQRRVQAVALHYRLTEEDFGGRLYLDSGRSQPLTLAEEDRRQGIIVHRPLVHSVIRTITTRQIDVGIFDPFVSTHRVPENDNGAIDRVAKEWAGIADVANCSIELVHHVRKNNGAELTVEDARGAVALIGAARSVRVLNPMTLEEAAKAGIEPPHRRLYFRADNGKANLAPPSADAKWYRLLGVGLGNCRDRYPEDSVGVVTAWTWPDAFAGLTSDDLHKVQNKVAAGTWRADVQATAWVGKAIADALGLDLEQAAAKAKAKTLLKTWLRNGALIEVEREDDNRKPRRFIEVGEWA